MHWTHILLVLKSLTPDVSDLQEPPEEREARFTLLAQAIGKASQNLETQAGIISAGYSETNFSAAVMRGECRRGGCDSGKAKGVWQLHPWCAASLTPSDLDGQAVCARRALLGPLLRCKTWEKAFGGYAAGHGCKPWPDRERLRRRILAKLHRASWKQVDSVEQPPQTEPDMKYDYQCRACKGTWEAEQRITEDPQTTCPHCGQAKAMRLISAKTSFALKGAGWYRDGYGSSGV